MAARLEVVPFPVIYLNPKRGAEAPLFHILGL
jgi:hypothetical protein